MPVLDGLGLAVIVVVRSASSCGVVSSCDIDKIHEMRGDEDMYIFI